ncbi:MAG: LacI family DNA-binding transcriptional regulator [Chthoniobacterales bacterium]|nr:LacI family DNA-binding transcriptional regulator [Chthoniobacterales bacterium]
MIDLMADAPTIRTLAKLAGVSSATVSLALRNHPRIRPQVCGSASSRSPKKPVTGQTRSSPISSPRSGPAGAPATKALSAPYSRPGIRDIWKSRPSRNGSRPARCAPFSSATASINSSSCNPAFPPSA